MDAVGGEGEIGSVAPVMALEDQNDDEAWFFPEYRVALFPVHEGGESSVTSRSYSMLGRIVYPLVSSSKHRVQGKLTIIKPYPLSTLTLLTTTHIYPP